MKIGRPVAVQLQVGVKNQIKVEWTHAFNHFPRVMYSFRKPHTTPRTIPDWSAKLLYLQRLLRTSCCRTATMLFWTSMIKTLFFASSQNVTSQTTQPHVNHHYRSITRPAKATDVRIKRRIFNDCTGNGNFEFSVDPTNLFWRDKRHSCA